MSSYSLATRRRLRGHLLAWFEQHQRDLPWRRTKDPYAVWVSEIMLQQTQVATVVPYYQRFLQRFPDPATLAAADEQTVLRFWEGLGYYRRARSLHRAAQVIVAEYGGVFPTDYSAVLALPGIGRYTAGAILSIALDQPLPILEGNTIRVHSRLGHVSGDVGKAATQKQLWALAEQIVDSERPGDLNQALMELGSEICSPRQPQCHACPVRSDCRAAAAGIQEQLPFSAKKEKFEEVREAVVLIRRKGRLLIRQCQPQERWAGLWDFPRFQLNPTDVAQQLRQLIDQQTGLQVQLRDTGWEIKHGVTRYRITLSCWVAEQVEGRVRKQGQVLQWIDPNQLVDLPLSVTGRKVASQLPELWDARSLL